jgi:hypothetical protein
MDKRIRRKMEMGSRVIGFSRAHPSADASYASVVGRMEELVARMQALSEQQQGGYISKRSSVLRRQELRRNLQRGFLRHLVTVAEVAAQGEPALAGLFRLPPPNATHETFRAVAHKLLEQGQAQREVLVKHGLADRLMDELAAAVAEFDASVVQTNDGKRGHIGARAELGAVSDEVMQLVEMLDGLNRYRFMRDPEMLATWERTRRVGPGAGNGEKEVPPEGEAGEVKPAA